MKKTLFVLLLLVSIPFNAQADEQAKRQLVEQLMTAMNASQMIKQVYAQMDKMFVGLGQQMGISEAERPIFEKFMKKMVAAMQEEMTWEKMKEPMIQIYLKHYTEQELKDVTAFYQSTSGQAMVKKMPQVMQESMMLSQSMFKDFMPKMKEISMELQKDLQAARKANEAPADPAK